MGLQLCPHMEGWKEGLKAMDLLYTDFPPYMYSDWEVSILHILP